MSKGPLLRPEEVASVLSVGEDTALAAADKSTSANAAVRTYSLRRPVAIAPDREAEARKRLERIAAGLQAELERELEATLRIEVSGFLQEQAGPALEAIASPTWVLSFLMADSGGIALALDPACALSLVELALGGVGNSADEVRGPTPLESRVLTSLCETVTPGLARSTGIVLTRSEFGTTALPVTLAMRGETIGVSPVRIFIGDQERGGLLVATPALLHEPNERDLLPHELRVGPLGIVARKIPITVRPVLRAGRVSFADLTALKSGQLLAFDSPETTPLELRLNGATVFAGRVERDGGVGTFRIGWRRGRKPAAAKEKK